MPMSNVTKVGEENNKSSDGPAVNAALDKQYQLFTQFVANANDSVSNSVELWESIPKYFFTYEQVKQLRTDGGHADTFYWNYTYKGVQCEIGIQPALLRQPDGTQKAFFPGSTEELVEEALKKILTSPEHGLHDSSANETWVRFSLRMIKRELDSRGRGRSVVEIRQALRVMNKCHLTLSVDGEEMWGGPILSNLTTVSRKDYTDQDSDSLHIAQLPPFISQGITRLESRQFNVDQLMLGNTQLSRWIYRMLVHRYTYAATVSDYHFKFSSLKESGFLQRSRERDNRNKVIETLEDLKENEILADYDTKEVRQGRRIVDVVYTVFAGRALIKAQKAANKANALRSAEREKLGLPAPQENPLRKSRPATKRPSLRSKLGS